MWFHSLIMFEFLLCSASTVALGALLLWHIRLIHYAETSIEVHTNRAEARRHRKKRLVSVLSLTVSLTVHAVTFLT